MHETRTSMRSTSFRLAKIIEAIYLSTKRAILLHVSYAICMKAQILETRRAGTIHFCDNVSFSFYQTLHISNSVCMNAQISKILRPRAIDFCYAVSYSFLFKSGTLNILTWQTVCRYAASAKQPAPMDPH